MQKFQVADLVPHEKNAYYFDDMTGDKWEEFKESIRTSGVIEPPVITGEMVIVSGHQRIRACKELGITEVTCEMRVYDSEDKVLKDLIETNIRQRGTISGSAKKMGLVYEELKRIYGVKEGRPGKLPQNAEVKTQTEIAEMMGKSVDTLERFASLKDLIPEFQAILDEKRISTSVASSLIAKLSEDEQLQLLRQLPAATKLTQSQVQAEVNKLKGEYEEKLASAEDRLVEAQEAQSLALPDEEYTQVAKERDDAKEQCRTWYEETQSKKKEIKSLESTLKAKEKEAVELARKLEKVVQEAAKKEDEAEQLRAKLRESGNEESVVQSQIKRVESMDIDPEKYALQESQRLQMAVSSFSNTLNTFIVLPDICRRMPIQYKSLIVKQAIEAIERMETIISTLKEGEETTCKTA